MSRNSRKGRPRLALWKRALFGLVMTVLVLALLEFVLFLAGVEPRPERGDPLVGFAKSVSHYVVETREDGVEIVRRSPEKKDFLNDQTFPRKKPEGAVRIFCVGGSTTYGRPFYDDLSFAGFLREILPAVDPSRNWEVINAGGISYASYRVAVVMEELAAFEPDVFLVYTGQNEFLEHRTYGRLLDTPGFVREAMAWAGRTRIGTVVRNSLPKERERSPIQMSVNPKIIPVNSVGPESYRRDDAFREKVLLHFRRNLDRMVDLAETAGAKIVFVIPQSNDADWAPFRSEPSPRLSKQLRAEFDRLYRQGVALRRAGKVDKAVEILHRAAAIGGRHAGAHYELGRACLAAGDADRAAREFVRARDEDICPMRAVTAVRETIREVAEERKVSHVRFEVEGCRENYYDHVHLTPEATLELARQVVPHLTGASVDPAILERIGTERLRGRDRVTHAASLRLLTRMLVELDQPEMAMRAAKDARELDSGNPDGEILLGTLVARDDPAAARRHYERALALDPKSAGALYHMALLEEREDDLAGAVSHLEAAVVAAPEFAAAWERLAMIQIRRGRVNDGVRCLEKVVDLTPERSTAHSNLGLARMKQGEPAKAMASYEEALRLDADNPSAHFNKGLLHRERDEREEAIAEFREVLRIRPKDAEARRHLAELGASPR